MITVSTIVEKLRHNLNAVLMLVLQLLVCVSATTRSLAFVVTVSTNTKKHRTRGLLLTLQQQCELQLLCV
jgi:hypothetical protein